MDLVRPCSLQVEGRISISYAFLQRQIFQGPNLIIMTIGATRMYRSLINLSITEV